MFDLHLGDCIEIMPSIPSGSVDAVITDPPYNVGIDYGQGIDDSKQNYAEWCNAWFAELKRICRGPIAISIGQANLSTWAAIEPPTWWLAWWKPAAMGRCVVGFNNWEPIALYGKTNRQVCDVVRATIKPDESIKGLHPCPKPIEWATKQIEMLTSPGDTVLDLFMGIGTTGIASRRMQRNFIGIEKHFSYFEVAKRRIEHEQTSLLEVA